MTKTYNSMTAIITMENMEVSELLNRIQGLPGDSLLEKTLSYAEENDIPEEELGSFLSESDQFKRLLWMNCVKNHQIKDEELNHKLNETQNLDYW